MSLAGDPAGDMAPRFLELLRTWRAASPGAEFVLPVTHRDTWPSSSWSLVTRRAGLEEFSPQALRRTFESMLAAIGFPSPLAAFWLGHSAAVAHKHYLAFAGCRLPGRTVEEVLGLVPFVDRAIERARMKSPLRLVAVATR